MDKKRESEIELDPGILTGEVQAHSPLLSDLIDRYLNEVQDIGQTKLYKLKYFKKQDFANLRLNKLDREVFASYVIKRRNGDDGYTVASKSTLEQDLYYLKSVLNYAEYVLNFESNALPELEHAMKGLRAARQIETSPTRDRLPTRQELIDLTNHFYALWQRPVITMPVHLIMWLAIYTTRRRGELYNLNIKDYDREHGVWLVRDVKNPKGSKGNHKRFKVSEKAKAIIEQLLDPRVRKKMMRLGGDPNLLIPLKAGPTTKKYIDACQMYGIDDLTWHDLRHEGATSLAEQGMSVPQIQQYTLHDSWGSLQRYVNLDLLRKNVLEFDEAIAIAKDTHNISNPNKIGEFL